MGAFLAIFVLAGIVSGVCGYFNSVNEVERLSDQYLLQQLDLLNTIFPGSLNQSDGNKKIQSIIAKNNKPSFVEFQWLTRDGQLLAKSAGMPEQVIAPLKEGFVYRSFNHYRWRVLIAPSEDNTTWFVVAQNNEQHLSVLKSIAWKMIYPMFFILPVVMVVMWLVISFVFRPLTNFSRELLSRDEKNVTPIVQQGLPVELNSLVQSINHFLQCLEISHVTSRRFFSDAAHELRTPIAALEIHGENLLHDEQSAPQSAVKICSGIQRVAYLVEQIMMLNRMAPDNFIGHFKPVNLTQLAKKIIVEHSEALESKQHQIEFNGDESWVLGDPLALEALVDNLLSNAIQYTPSSGQICINTWLRGRDVVLEVMDNGPGIPEDEYKKVFQRFYRIGGDQHDSQTLGCGIGLSIVEEVVNLHGAVINMTQSRFGHGLLAMITFVAIPSPDLKHKDSLVNVAVSL